ncbi:DNA cytosine methyltransferase [Planctomycetota bacterium]
MEGVLKHVELFAGCGGMSLGLEAAGFKLAFANELSPMASETFAHNLLPNGLDDAYWIKSNYKKNQLHKRLLENPNCIKPYARGDFTSPLELPNKHPFLLVGDISGFTKKLHGSHAKKFRKHIGPVTLLSGGPPCQSFSCAGKRESNNKRNSLFLQFAQMANVLHPKVVLFENVSGIIHPFTNGDGSQKHTWFEIVKEFMRIGYVPVCFHLNTKELGLPQHRTRFIMIALQDNLVRKIKSANSPYLKRFSTLFDTAWNFYIEFRKTTNRCKIPYDRKRSLGLMFDGTDGSLPSMFDPLFSTTLSPSYCSVESAIDSIKNLEGKYHVGVGKYGKYLRNQFRATRESTEPLTLQNHDNRTHSDLVKARFMMLQAVSEMDEETRQAISGVLKRDGLSETDIPRSLVNSLMKHRLSFLDDNDKIYKWGPCNGIATQFEVKQLIIRLKSKKQAQRALVANMPAPAQLSIPDDLCHYDKSNPRTLTVREMARIQTFPDWFVFKGKATTGGHKRSYEVPQYTQVGNAVPPLLAKIVGKNLVRLIERLSEIEST